MDELLPCMRECEFQAIIEKIDRVLLNEEYEKAFKTFIMEVSKANKIDTADFLYFKKYKL